MPKKLQKRKPQIAHPLKPGISYGRAADALRCSRQHVYLVCRGDRESRRLLTQLDLAGLLEKSESGIGKN